MKLLLFISIVFLISCSEAENEKLVIDKNRVDHIEIRKRLDTLSLRLSDDQFESFFTMLESSVSKTPCKVFEAYVLMLHLKDGRMLTYGINEDIIRGDGGYVYSIGDKDYFKNIWLRQAGLTENYYEYFPTYKDGDGYSQVIETLDPEKLERITQVLTDHGHKFVDVRGVLFYEGYLSEEQLSDYTSKARSVH